MWAHDAEAKLWNFGLCVFVPLFRPVIDALRARGVTVDATPGFGPKRNARCVESERGGRRRERERERKKERKKERERERERKKERERERERQREKRERQREKERESVCECERER